MLVIAGAVGAPGVLLLPLQREFGWSTAAISSAMAVRLLLFGLMGPFAREPTLQGALRYSTLRPRNSAQSPRVKRCRQWSCASL
jgi:hypothetical protein